MWGPPCRDADRVQILVFGARKTWHRQGIWPLKYAEMLAKQTKYGQMLTRRGEDGHSSDFQTYACRAIVGYPGTWSFHSWPRAADIRPWENPCRDDGVLVTDFDMFGLKDGLNFIGSFFAAGFDWGSTWDDTDGSKLDKKCRIAKHELKDNGKKIRNGRVDSMHFELDDDGDTWTDAKCLKKLRRYRIQHPVKMSKILKDADAKDCKGLMKRWREGKA